MSLYDRAVKDNTRILTRELGAGPLALARAQRAQTARTLLETTTWRTADIAFAASHSSGSGNPSTC